MTCICKLEFLAVDATGTFTGTNECMYLRATKYRYVHVMHVPSTLLEAFPFTRDRGCISYVVQERRQLGLPRKRRFTLRLADALVVMDSRLVTQVENMATMSNLEALEVDLNGTMSNTLRKSLLLCLTSFTFPCLVTSILNTLMQ